MDSTSRKDEDAKSTLVLEPDGLGLPVGLSYPHLMLYSPPQEPID